VFSPEIEYFWSYLKPCFKENLGIEEATLYLSIERAQTFFDDFSECFTNPRRGH